MHLITSAYCDHVYFLVGWLVLTFLHSVVHCDSWTADVNFAEVKVKVQGQNCRTESLHITIAGTLLVLSDFSVQPGA